MFAGYFYSARLAIISSLAYRFEVYATLASNFVLLLTTLFLWRAAYHGVASVAGVRESQMLTYAVLSALLGTVFTFRVQSSLYGKLRMGRIEMDFIRPVNPLFRWLFEDLGASVSSLAMYLLPLLIASIIFIKVPFPHDSRAFGLFLVSAALSYAILWILSALVGCVGFWITDLGDLGIITTYIVRIFSGSFVPIWFFPMWIQAISRWLPFQYTYQSALGIYVGKIGPHAALTSLTIQCVWILILGTALHFVWVNAQKRLSVQGG